MKYQLDKYYEGVKIGKQEERKRILEIINKANINISNAFFNDRCNNCNENIEPAIHHFVDYFYKEIIQELENSEVKK
jgi:uncharacterized protein with PIN domain